MQGDTNKQNLPDEEPGTELTGRFTETLAAYFEQRNSGAPPAEVAAAFHEVDDEIRQAIALLQFPERVALTQPDIDRAWQNFRVQAFVAASAPVTQVAPEANSLGGYVNEALQTGQVVKDSGLPRETLEALRADATPLSELKGFELADYAALAKRYGVKDNLFPRMLKWLKGLGKSFTAPSFGSLSSRPMYARQEDYKHQVDEEFLAGEMQRTEPKENQAQEGETDDKKEG